MTNGKKKIQSVSLQKKLQNVNSCLVNMTLSQMIRGIKDDEFKKKKNLCSPLHIPPTPVFLPGEFQGRGSLVSCRLWGHTESDVTETT